MAGVRSQELSQSGRAGAASKNSPQVLNPSISHVVVNKATRFCNRCCRSFLASVLRRA